MIFGPTITVFKFKYKKTFQTAVANSVEKLTSSLHGLEWAGTLCLAKYQIQERAKIESLVRQPTERKEETKK